MNNFSLAVSAIKKGYLLIVAITLLGFVVGFWRGTQAKPSFIGVVTLTVTNASQAPTGQYAFDNYYSLSAAAVGFDTIASIATSPNYIEKIYRNAGVKLPTGNLKSLSKAFTVNKTSLQASSGYIQTFSIDNENEAKVLASSLSDVLDDTIASWHTSKKLPDNITVSISDPSIFSNPPNPSHYSIFGGVIGFMLALYGILIRSALRQDS